MIGECTTLQYGCVAWVTKLSGDAENVGRILLNSLFVVGRRRSVKERDFQFAVLDAMPQNLDNTAFGDFTLKPSQKLSPLWVVCFKT